MIKLRSKRGKARSQQRGQGLVEYALILVLVAVVVIAIAAVLGQDVRQVYCDIVFELDPDIDAPFCDAPSGVPGDPADDDDDDGEVSVTCSPSGGAISNPIGPSASVSDTAGDSNVARVEFSLSGPSSRTWTEYINRYCLYGGGDGGSSCDTASVTTGSYTMTATAYDDDGNSGSCSASFTVN